MAGESAEDEKRPITALPLFGAFGLYAYADGGIVGVDNASGAVTLKDPELPCSDSIFQPSHRSVVAVPTFDADAAGTVASAVQDFKRIHMEAFLPAHIKHLADHWPALGKWDFAYFSDYHGSQEVHATLPNGKRKMVQLADYIAEISSRTEIEGCVNQSPAEKPYLRGWYYEQDIPELAADLWKPGDFHETAFRDWFKRLPRRHHPDFHWLFIGAAGATTPLHVDPTATHAWLTQIHGRKRFVLFPPCDLQALLREHSGGTCGALVSLEVAQGRGLNGIEVILEPGDTLFVPAFWAHQVECVDDSISVTWNFLGEQLYPLVRMAYLAHQLGANARAAVAESNAAQEGGCSEPVVATAASTPGQQLEKPLPLIPSTAAGAHVATLLAVAGVLGFVAWQRWRPWLWPMRVT